MAATLVSPSAPYHHRPHHNSFSSGYPHSAPPTSIPGMISPVEPRRASDESEPGHSHRQSLPSLPSISEVFSDRKPLAYGPPPSSAPMPPAQSLPSPFSATAPPRPFADVASPDKTTSPRALHPAPSTFPSRTEALPAFSDPARPPLASRPIPPPLNTFPGQHPSPPVKLEHLEAEQRPAAQPAQPLPGLYAETGRLPPGQLPLSAYPISPRHSGPPLPSPYEAQRPPVYGEETGYSPHRPSEYKADFDKHFQTYGYQDALQIIMSSCRTGYHFAEAYGAAAREQQGSQPIPSRMPTENEVSLLLNSLILALKKLEEVRDMVQQNRIQNERARDSGSRKPEDEDISMYGDGIKPAYALSEVKKRRGRAAPPGRCHSCNRIDTPEWRRGPDGARTLCNACGLHYAKLERKRQLDQRSLRPKPADERK
ncbi:uncharacterized protein THITE_2106568 [Thermothielavioides terrestris NRRL 8126]|uniref:GATA-type domain-containing protein n=1 Tax=Thermothielavioides terrestris (strain ATCC 38088 / NRRL 8126) TaxID=578455 RepID=G2QQM1_THETT|nr:uncharacterized protein THITE_2106568 [Thermothielavioides terrestris NRRL 8126]AEO62431.1 hypothetical protein THITE_2106568 [Thermothielavioides terrestris NRRL 8126]